MMNRFSFSVVSYSQRHSVKRSVGAEVEFSPHIT